MSESNQSGRLFAAGNLLPFILVTSLFFLWGIPNNLNDVLIKQFMKSFEISRFQAGLVQSAFYMGYFLLSIPAAMVMRKYSYKVGLVSGLLLYAAGTFLFWPAARVGEYGFFLFALFVIASGLSFLETGANPFIARLGSHRTAEQRLNFSQAFNPIGAVLGVVIGKIFIFSGIEHSEAEVSALKSAGEYQVYLQHETMRVVTPYLVLGVVVLVVAFLIMKVKFPNIGEEGKSDESKKKTKIKDLFKFPHFVQGVLAQFFYVGAQVGTWSYFIQYAQDYTGVPEKMAANYLIGTLVAFGVGRFSATWIMKYFKPNKLMGLYAFINVALVGIGVIYPGSVGLWAILLTSFFMSLMFPTIFSLAIKGLGPHTKLGGSLVVMAIIGGAVFTPLMGIVFQVFDSMAMAMGVPFLCYLFVAYYAFIGSKVKDESLLVDAPDPADMPIASH